MQKWRSEQEKEKLKARLMFLHRELSELDEYFSKPVENRPASFDAGESFVFMADVPSYREMRGKEDRREYVREEIEKCTNKLVQLGKGMDE